MGGTPILLKVRLAFGTYPVGYIFKSPPLPGTLRQEWLSKGLLEVVDDKNPENRTEKDKPKELGRKRLR